MNTRTKLILLFLFLYSIPIFATGDSTRFLLPHDSVFILIGEYPEKVIEHRLSSKQTYYSLARHYGLEVAELDYFNPGLKAENLKPGDIIRIPVPNASIRRYTKKNFVRWKYAPIYYKVKPGDNMFKIAKEHFKMPIDTLKKRNKYWKDDVTIGQILQVGWLPTKGVPDSLQKLKGHPLWKGSDQLESKFTEDKAVKKKVTERGVTVWPKNQPGDSNESYILHNSAKIGSIIAVTNPMTNRTVYAKCIGRIPEKVYPGGVKAVISAPIAVLLGVRDERFFSYINYLK